MKVGSKIQEMRDPETTLPQTQHPVDVLQPIQFEQFADVLLGLGGNSGNGTSEQDIYELPPVLAVYRDVYCAVVNYSPNVGMSAKSRMLMHQEQWSKKSEERLRKCLAVLPPLAPADTELSTDPATAAVT